jgi:hypothetical protein
VCPRDDFAIFVVRLALGDLATPQSMIHTLNPIEKIKVNSTHLEVRMGEWEEMFRPWMLSRSSL